MCYLTISLSFSFSLSHTLLSLFLPLFHPCSRSLSHSLSRNERVSISRRGVSVCKCAISHYLSFYLSLSHSLFSLSLFFPSFLLLLLWLSRSLNKLACHRQSEWSQGVISLPPSLLHEFSSLSVSLSPSQERGVSQ